ncbi:polysaccharide deacetylase family protein [Sulfurisoma sediminicola]|uniref:Polysaccharide deacetylase n=1 Tax=Sulfurisoma sediminicola TaxID=1381557 RepID=A0A497XKS3_9PROT|nr:polysaccharide deacetylase family protein [Sulfurisoma sediminicola]RLJ67997.1 polysaccharide deacetylase [Sulfurisoma sediminicola]
MGAVSLLRQLLRPLRGRQAPEATFPSLKPLDDYVAAARKLGLERPCLFLSFDCDTDLDADAAEEVHDFLESLGIKATYAVPGAQLLKSPAPYRRLAERGAEFMNHGGLPHAEWREDQWAGITFYDSMTPEAVEADIRRGHEIVTEVIGRAPLGFRAPHFGCYQKPQQVDLLHRTAASLGYRYCSTTIPSFGLKFGPAYETHGLVEVPCFGSARYPETILDSWTYLTDRKSYALGDQYLELMTETVEMFLDRQIPAVLTWYADPCHVLDQPPFIRAMELLAKSGVASVAGAELAALVSGRH